MVAEQAEPKCRKTTKSISKDSEARPKTSTTFRVGPEGVTKGARVTQSRGATAGTFRVGPEGVTKGARVTQSRGATAGTCTKGCEGGGVRELCSTETKQTELKLGHLSGGTRGCHERSSSDSVASATAGTCTKGCEGGGVREPCSAA